jgi:hypothetical protein
MDVEYDQLIAKEAMGGLCLLLLVVFVVGLVVGGLIGMWWL